MFNTDLPSRADLPTAAQLARSTRRAALAAAAILALVVLPAEYGIDPTGAGRLVGLTEMGEIKRQLAAEAEADAVLAAAEAAPAAPVAPTVAAAVDPAALAAQVERAVAEALAARDAVAAAAPAPETTLAAAPAPEARAPALEAAPAAAGRSDEIAITLVPGEGAEVKLVMAAGARAAFAWSVEGGVANFDLHGDGGGRKISYEQGRGVPGQEGTLEAAFDGNHGWFWRNRGAEPVTILLRTEGDYAELKRVI
jgi:hypothetical protein